MLIALSGKIQSGKDTIGKIIQYLIVKTKENSIIATEGVYSPTSLEDFEAFCKCDTDNLSNWHIVKFADALKDIVCILTGCTREQLESDEFKTSKLSDEWIRYGYADGFIKTYIGNGEMSGAIMNNKQCSKEEYEEHYKINWQTAYKSHLTYRELLQYIGTDLLRNQLNDNVWINALFSKYDKNKINEFTDKPISKTGELIPLEPIISKYDKIRYKCFCGKTFKTTPYKVKIGHTKSCGCYQKTRAGETQYKDGRKGSRLWTIYNNMIQRCENPNQPRYKDYGERGITVSDSFKPFENFKLWAESNGYNSKLTLDRIDVNDIYCPDNCRFTTASVQAINARKRSDNTSGYRGVSFEIRENKWRSQIQIDKVVKFLGYFDTPEAASLEYEKWYKIRESKYLKRVNDTNAKSWIITDVRFPNEATAVKDRGGFVIRVNRIHNEKLLHDIAIASAPFGVGIRMIEQNESYNHPSETSLDDYPFDYTISNDSTIEELIEEVKFILIKENIL